MNTSSKPILVLISIGLWLMSFVVASGLAVYQRLTGPTHPLRGATEIGGQEIRYRLLRSHGGPGGLDVAIEVGANEIDGEVIWRRFPTNDEWIKIPMRPNGSAIESSIPHQPPAGKVEYQVRLSAGADSVLIPSDVTAVARFKGSVAAGVLIPHIIAMFASLLIYTRALFEAIRSRGERGRVLVLVATACLILGGLVLGPMVQKMAFGAYWTGWPFGEDLTDNKTAFALLAWAPALVVLFKRRKAMWTVVLGWVVMMAVFLIPHSVQGSEIDWQSYESEVTAESTPPG